MTLAEKLPDNWNASTLGLVAHGFLSGGTPSTKNEAFWQGSVPWITSKWLNSRLYIDNGEKFISEDALKQSATTVVPRNNLIFATRVGVGKVAVNNIDLAINQDLAGVLVDSDRHDIRFLAYQLRSDRIQRTVASHKRGATIQGITRDALKELEIYLPPLAEQGKIAEVLGLVQRALQEQEWLIALTKELKKALLHQLFTQGLRGEPRKQTEIGPVPQSWEVVKLEDAAVAFDYGTSVKCERGKAGVPVLRIPNVVVGSIDLSDLKHGHPKRSELEQLRLRDGDLLFVRTNGVLENAGRCALYRGELEGCYFASYLIRVRVDSSKVLAAFVNEYARTETGRSFLSGRAIRTADGKFNINSGTLKRVMLPLPNISEQTEIVDDLNLAERKLSLHHRKHAAFTALFRTLLHQLMTAQVRVHDLELCTDNLTGNPVLLTRNLT